MNKRNQIFFTAYLAALAAFAPFSTDIYLASMPIIQKSFHTHAANVQLTLSLFFVGFAVMQLIWGPLSDRIGRKAVIFTGLMTFIAGSLLCAVSQNITSLIIARIIQALGACAGIVMATASVKDHFKEPKAVSNALSRIMSIMMLAPMIAPIIGSYLLARINWQSNFYFLAIYGAMLFFATFFIQESHPKAIRRPLKAKHLITAYIEQTKSIPFLLPTLAASTNFSAMFCFISSSSFIYIKLYGLPPSQFGYFFAVNAAALILGSISLNRLKEKLSDQHIMQIAMTLTLSGSCVMLIALTLKPSIFSIAAPSFIVTFGIGLLYPEIIALALKHVVHHTGLASSLIGTTRFTLAAITGFIMGLVITYSALPLAISMLILNVFTLILMHAYRKAEASR
ncbi:MAG: Bcr/CflA family drug resistance efflux transporter [Gammaproteobacteria bacterium CG11_big_fil_rev_8_21_14_0_20_46_22]|nr:MAG: Bcr/CflA family drug resistance efflux transporter [Gammaproteobacteria bacterium CG12_big_fil_rev_8_21_14_0_65_46_12]PIR11790.1 MAG: Bcr/CflA family drug resistance efflux transporter [Gammaproteobacteria bacterium CG11_big_fil_rev_8_21_14_0_20_46_22]